MAHVNGAAVDNGPQLAAAALSANLSPKLRARFWPSSWPPTRVGAHFSPSFSLARLLSHCAAVELSWRARALPSKLAKVQQWKSLAN